MGLFDKKYCDVCGEKIRFLGNRKLEDGNLCKDCAEKLSVWFSDRRSSTVAEIKAQLQDREANRARVESFQTSRSYGEHGRILIDDSKGEWIALRSHDSLRENPDVIRLDQVVDAQIDVDTSKTEEKTKDAEGKQVSYNPPRYRYTYQFYLIVHVKHPWFDDIRVKYNKDAVIIETGAPVQLPGMFSAARAFTPQQPEPERNADYQRYMAMGNEMCNALLNRNVQASAQPVPQEAPQAAAVPQQMQKVACPYCKAVAVPDAGGHCIYCGSKIV